MSTFEQKEKVQMEIDEKNEDCGLDEDMGDDSITVVSSDGTVRLEVDVKDASISTLIKATLENDPTMTEVTLPAYVEATSLAAVVEYMKHHKGEEPEAPQPPLHSPNMKKICKEEWDANFIDGIGGIGVQSLYDLILTANFLGMETLVKVSAAKIASLAMGKEPDEIKKALTPA
jgi:S-phase kinase-associated protein 1